jgi:hypothetical protein
MIIYLSYERQILETELLQRLEIKDINQKLLNGNAWSYEWDVVKIYIERQFRRGMSWDNHGE